MRVSRLLFILALLLSVGLIIIADVNGETLRISKLADLPTGSKGWMICWANGLTCVGNDEAQWVFLDKRGRTTRVFRPEQDCLPLSSQCGAPLMFSRFYGNRFGMVHLDTGKYEYIFQSKEAYWAWFMNYYPGSFWSPDCTTVLALSMPKRHESNTLVFIDRLSKKAREWSVDQGKISSWAWSQDDGQRPWVLTVSPGFLYRALSEDKAGLPVPSLDTAKYAMLSPTHDRVIGFVGRGIDPFLVDIHRPYQQQRIKFNGASIRGVFVVQWSHWSPDGRKVAMLLRRKGVSQPELYVGNPSTGLEHVVRYPFSFPDVSSLYQDVSSLYQAEGMITVWGANSDELFCVMTDGAKGSGAKSKYMIGRLKL